MAKARNQKSSQNAKYGRRIEKKMLISEELYKYPQGKTQLLGHMTNLRRSGNLILKKILLFEAFI